MNATGIASSVRRLAAREWLLLLALLASLAAVLGWQNGIGRPDQAIYDMFVSAQTRPARDDIVIVAIDDYSLAQLGRWPWPRTLHAQLIDRLTAARPAAIGLDVILSEPGGTAADGSVPGDDALAAALARSRRVVLPVTTGSIGDGSVTRLPVPALAHAAAGLGHIGLDPDRDGVIRSVYLREGTPGHWWPQFAAALIAAGSAAAAPSPLLHAAVSGDAPDRRWQSADRMRIPFAGGAGHFRSIPYVAALRGEVPNDFFTGKTVLIGATAAGLADGYPTPVSGSAGTMPGVEIHANVLASLLDHRRIDDAPPWQTALLGVLAVAAAMLGYLRLSPRAALLCVSLLGAAVVAASYAALAAGIWIAPAAALLALALSYPLWSWRRLEAAMRYLDQEFRRLDHEPRLLPEADAPQPRAAAIDDLLARRIDAMADAARRVRDLRQFISDSLDSLPDATLVTTVDGHVLLANRQAIAYFESIGMPQVHDALLPYLFSTLHFPQPVSAGDAPAHGFEWWHLIDPGRRIAPDGISVQDRQDRDLLVKSAPCHSASRELIGWIVSITDISAIRAAERSHEETVRFLSHDMRAPQASILALLELQSQPASALPQEEFFARIERACRKTLGLADNFVHLARAESNEYRMEEIDFQEIVFDATDEMWTLARNKQIYLASDIDRGEYPARVDRSLMTRALINLISNAIHYSPSGTRIVCSLHAEMVPYAPLMVFRIADEGYGIAEEDQARLFQRFQRFEIPGQPRQDGSGLGLAFVKTVVERHHGRIAVDSRVGRGTTFTITLPLIA